MKKFKAKVDMWFYFVVILVVIFSLGLVITTEIAAVGVGLFTIGLMLWILFDTGYAISEKYLHYKSAFLRGKIPLDKIRKLEVGKTLWVGIKPAMAVKGIIISYQYEEVYVAPIDNEKLISALLIVNPNIEVIRCIK